MSAQSDSRMKPSTAAQNIDDAACRAMLLYAPHASRTQPTAAEHASPRARTPFARPTPLCQKSAGNSGINPRNRIHVIALGSSTRYCICPHFCRLLSSMWQYSSHCGSSSLSCRFCQNTLTKNLAKTKMIMSTSAMSVATTA